MPEAKPGEAMSATVIEASRAYMAAAQRTNTLYELSADYMRILDLLESGQDDATLEVELDQVAGLITHKAEAIAGLIAHLNGIGGMRRAEAERLRTRAQTDERKAERLKAYLLKHMQFLGSERIETTRFTLTVRANPPAVEVLEQALVPEEYIRTVTTTSVDKRAILDQFKKDGDIPPGVEIVRGTRLDIR
jgi:hypothetical protein